MQPILFLPITDYLKEVFKIRFEGLVDVIIITINSISETLWNAGTADVISLDVDGNPSTPDVDVSASATVIFTR